MKNYAAYKENNDQIEAANLIKRVSPVAWQHINLRGRYQFRNKKQHEISFAEIIGNLSETSFEESLKKDLFPIN